MSWILCGLVVSNIKERDKRVLSRIPWENTLPGVALKSLNVPNLLQLSSQPWLIMINKNSCNLVSTYETRLHILYALVHSILNPLCTWRNWLRESKELVQGHTAYQWQRRQDLKTVYLHDSIQWVFTISGDLSKREFPLLFVLMPLVLVWQTSLLSHRLRPGYLLTLWDWHPGSDYLPRFQSRFPTWGLSFRHFAAQSPVFWLPALSS